MLGEEWCETKGYNEELPVLADDMGMAGVERKASLDPRCGVAAGRFDGHSLGNAALLCVLMPGYARPLVT